MTEYTLDKYDFKKYLLDHLSDARQEELIFWKKSIPIPVDLVYEVFDRRGSLLSSYIHHIGAAFLFAWIARKEHQDWPGMLAQQPTPENNILDIKTKFTMHADESGVKNLLGQIAELFLLENYRTEINALATALCHKGKKYERIFLPPAVKEKINAVFPELLQHVAVSNGDMFSNVVADELKIYRNGFADAFSAIFNKLTEFILRYSSGTKSYNNASGVRITQESENDNQGSLVTYGNVSDGCIWEPLYSNARTTFMLNKSHPFCDQIRKAGPDAEKLIGDLIAVLAVKENEVFRTADKKILEIFRQDVSRELRILAESAGLKT